MSSGNSAPPKKKRRILRKIAFAFLFLILFVVLNVVFPNVLIAGIAEGQIEGGLSSSLTCNASIGALSLDFFGTNTVKDLEIKPDNHPAERPAPIRCAHMAVGVQPFSLTSETIEVTTIELRGLRVAGRMDSTGLDLLDMLKSRNPAPEVEVTPDPEPTVKVEDKIFLVKLEKVALDDIDVSLVMVGPESLRVPGAPARLVDKVETLAVKGFAFHMNRITLSSKGTLLTKVPWDLSASFWHGEKELGRIALKGEFKSDFEEEIAATLEAELDKLDLGPYLDLRGSGKLDASVQLKLKDIMSSTAKLALTIPQLTVSGHSSKDLSLSLEAKDKKAEAKLRVGELIGGTFEATAGVGFGDEALPWNVQLACQRLPVTRDWFRPLEHVSPIFAVAVVPEDIQGEIRFNLTASSKGTTPEEVFRHLKASGSIGSKGLVVSSPIFAALAALLKDDKLHPLRFDNFEQSFAYESGGFASSGIPITSGRTKIDIVGKTSVDGELDYGLRISAIDGRDLSFLNLGKSAFSIKGTVDNPVLDAPGSVGELFEDTLKGALEGGLPGVAKGLGETFGQDKVKEGEEAQKEIDKMKNKLKGLFGN